MPKRSAFYSEARHVLQALPGPLGRDTEAHGKHSPEDAFRVWTRARSLAASVWNAIFLSACLANSPHVDNSARKSPRLKVVRTPPSAPQVPPSLPTSGRGWTPVAGSQIASFE